MASRTSGDLVIETSSLRKEFTGRGGTRVVDLDLAVPRGGVHGLGPNGSGKTTTIRMLLCLARLTGAIVGAAVLALFWGGAWDVGSSRDITAPGELVLAVVVVVAIVLSLWSIQRRDVP